VIAIALEEPAMTVRQEPADVSSTAAISTQAILAAWGLVGMLAMTALVGGLIRSPAPLSGAVAGAPADASARLAGDIVASIALGEFESPADRAAILAGLDGADADRRGEPAAAVVAQSAAQPVRSCHWLASFASNLRLGG
jgi:hypothetical protein